jgi:hypothetical protein
MVREVRSADAEFLLDLAGHHAFRMRSQEQLRNAEPRFGSYGRKHVSESGNLLGRWLFHSAYTSTIVEMLKSVKGFVCCPRLR